MHKHLNFVINDRCTFSKSVLKISETDNLPNKICDVCFQKVNEFYCFRNVAVESDSRFVAPNILQFELYNYYLFFATYRLNDTQNLKDIKRNLNNENSQESDFKCPKWIYNDDISNVALKSEPLVQILSRNSVQTQTEDFPNLLKFAEVKEEVIENTSLEVDVYDNLSLKNEYLIDNQAYDIERTNQFDYCESNDLVHSSNLNHEKVKGQKKSRTHNSDEAKHSSDKANFTSKDAHSSDAKYNDNLYTKEIWVCCVCFKKYKNREGILKHYK